MPVRNALVLLVLSLTTLSCAPTSPETKKPVAPPAADTAGVLEAYRAWVVTQTDELVTQTEAFAKAILSGDRAGAQALYPHARTFYEKIEPIAEAFGDLDPQIDAREGDVPAEQWKGFHVLEKLLWSSESLSAGGTVAKALVDDVHLLRAKVETAEITVSSMVTGAVELLNEVSTSKVTGEEDRYSHTDLWDFEANVEGSAKILELLAPTVEVADATLAATLKDRFSALKALLDSHKKGDGFKLYQELKPVEVKALSAAIDAVAEPLSQLGKLFPAVKGTK